ncbi:MAG: cobalamin-independent methionine synthase II family protein, partial [Chloroflexi bacterium]|nr:cobalamin-independent methionine synthase II family protein [Chloroflexota bacterium]
MAAAAFRADHVGSLLRPPEVLQAHADLAQGRVSAEEVRAIEDRAILAVFDVQRQAGVAIFTDGEFRRGSWAGDFADAVEGYVPGEPPIKLAWKTLDGQVRAPAAPTPSQAGRVIGQPLRQHRRLTAHESAFVKQHAPGPCKVTTPAASYTTARGFSPAVTLQAYGSRAELAQAVGEIMRSEVNALAEEGIDYIQLDNAHYPDYIPEDRRAELKALGIDPEQSILEDIEADNLAIRDVDRSRHTVAMHICRGNGPGSVWHTQGGYEAIAEQVFGSLNVDRFLLEYDSERAGGFEPLRFMPKNKTVVLGLVTTKSGQLESQDLLLRRIEEAARYVDMERLALSPQCGFASVAPGNAITADEQRRKLELVATTAARA